MATGEHESAQTQVVPVKGDLAAVDLARLDQALDACDFILEHLTPEGGYHVDESWGPEGVSYLSEIPAVFLEAYRITRGRKYLDGARTILDHLQSTQLSSGGWTSKIGPGGLEFIASAEERRLAEENEDLPLIGTITYGVAKYRRLIGDGCYNGMVERALDHLLVLWDAEQGCFVEQRDEVLMGMRSHPTAYQALLLLGLAAWRPWRESLESIVPKLAVYIRGGFESFDDEAMPFMRVIHAVLLMNHCSRDYVVNEIKPRLDRLIGSDVFKCAGMVGGYGHRDGHRGIVNTEANIRGSGAVAIGMKFYDLTTGTRTYRDSDAYRDVAAWLDSMKAERGYYGYQTQSDKARKGRGSPAQIIPCWWIFGQF